MKYHNFQLIPYTRGGGGMADNMWGLNWESTCFLGLTTRNERNANAKLLSILFFVCTFAVHFRVLLLFKTKCNMCLEVCQVHQQPYDSCEYFILRFCRLDSTTPLEKLRKCINWPINHGRTCHGVWASDVLAICDLSKLIPYGPTHQLTTYLPLTWVMCSVSLDTHFQWLLDWVQYLIALDLYRWSWTELGFKNLKGPKHVPKKISCDMVY